MNSAPLSIIGDDHLRAIGAVIVNWTAIEMAMELTVLGIYQIPVDRGLVITNNLTFQNKMAMLRILATKGAIPDPGGVRDMLSILDRIEAAGRERNKVAHGAWVPSGVQGVERRFDIRVRGKRLTTDREAVPLSDLEGMARSFVVLHADFADLARRLGFEPSLSLTPSA